MGILDLPSPLLSGIDGRLMGFLPPVAKLLLWAAVGALLSMELYRLLSPQQRIVALKEALQTAQARVANYDGSFEEAKPLLGEMLSLAVRRTLIVLPSTLIASLPLLVLIVWLDTAYSAGFPPRGEAVSVSVPGDYQGRWIDNDPPRVKVLDQRGDPVAKVPVPAPIPIVHKRRWWNVLIGNPAGYLPKDAPVDWIQFELPRQQFLSFGPEWLRGWHVIFFAALILFALTFKTVRRIE